MSLWEAHQSAQMDDPLGMQDTYKPTDVVVSFGEEHKTTDGQCGLTPDNTGAVASSNTTPTVSQITGGHVAPCYHLPDMLFLQVHAHTCRGSAGT